MCSLELHLSAPVNGHCVGLQYELIEILSHDTAHGRNAAFLSNADTNCEPYMVRWRIGVGAMTSLPKETKGQLHAFRGLGGHPCFHTGE